MFSSSFSIRSLLAITDVSTSRPVPSTCYAPVVEDISSDESSSSSADELSRIWCGQPHTGQGLFEAVPNLPAVMPPRMPAYPAFQPTSVPLPLPLPVPVSVLIPRPTAGAIQLYQLIRNIGFDEPITLTFLKGGLRGRGNVHSAIRELIANGQLARSAVGLYYRPVPGRQAGPQPVGRRPGWTAR